MRIVHGILYFLICAVIASECRAENPQQIFGNMAYIIGNEHYSRKVTLADGKHEEPFLCVYYEDKYIYGDFNADGLRDAAVVIAESGSGSGYFRMLAFLINDGRRLVHKSTRYLGDRVVINSIKERRGKIFIDMFIHDKSDCMARPTKRVKNVYEYYSPGIEK